MTRRAPGFVAAAFFDSAALLFIVVAIALAGSLAAYIFRDGLGMGLTILAAAALGTLTLLAAVRGWRLLASRSPLLDKAGRLFGLFLLCGFRIALAAQDLFSKYLVCGLVGMIGLEAMVNIGVVTGLLPTKGLPLPLVSYGGSNLVATLMALGIAGSVYARRYALV